MKTYAEAVTQQAVRRVDAFIRGDELPKSDAETISFIYNVPEGYVEMDIQEEYRYLVDSTK